MNEEQRRILDKLGSREIARRVEELPDWSKYLEVARIGEAYGRNVNPPLSAAEATAFANLAKVMSASSNWGNEPVLVNGHTLVVLNPYDVRAERVADNEIARLKREADDA